MKPLASPHGAGAALTLPSDAVRTPATGSTIANAANSGVGPSLAISPPLVATTRAQRPLLAMPGTAEAPPAKRPVAVTTRSLPSLARKCTRASAPAATASAKPSSSAATPTSAPLSTSRSLRVPSSPMKRAKTSPPLSYGKSQPAAPRASGAGQAPTSLPGMVSTASGTSGCESGSESVDGARCSPDRPQPATIATSTIQRA